MSKHEVIVFREYQLTPGQKIKIENGLRRGDWLVVSSGEKKIRLRCPVSGVEIECDKTFSLVEMRVQDKWPGD